MDFNAKQRLCQKIEELVQTYPSTAQRVLEIISKYEPDKVVDGEKEQIAFDVLGFNLTTLSVLEDYVNTFMFDPFKEKESHSSSSLLHSPNRDNPYSEKQSINYISSFDPGVAVPEQIWEIYTINTLDEQFLIDPINENVFTFPGDSVSSPSSNTETTSEHLEFQTNNEQSIPSDIIHNLPPVQNNQFPSHQLPPYQIYDQTESDPLFPKELAQFNPQKDPKTGKFTIQVEIYDVRDGTLECPKCNKMFKNRSNLLKHIRVHTGEKPHVCNFCGKSFRHSNTLKDHINTHQDPSRFSCSQPGCSKSFANAANLSRHLRTHTGAKPFKCSHCNKRFNQSSNCKQHEKTHLKIKLNSSYISENFI